MGCQNSKKLRAVDRSQSRDKGGSEPTQPAASSRPVAPPPSGQVAARNGPSGGKGHDPSSASHASNQASNSKAAGLRPAVAEDDMDDGPTKPPAGENGRLANGGGHAATTWAARPTDVPPSHGGEADAKQAGESKAALESKSAARRPSSSSTITQVEPMGRSASTGVAATAEAASKGGSKPLARESGHSEPVANGSDSSPFAEDRAPGQAQATQNADTPERVVGRNQATPDGTPSRTPARSRNVSVSRHNQTGHMAFKVATATHIGFGPLKRENQDEVYVEKCLQGHESASVFCVFDGHGARGKDVSTFVRDRLPYILSQAMEGTQTSEEIHAALTESFLRTNAELREGPIDCSMSGTTCCVAYVRGHDLHVASCGDSRAVLVCEVARDELPGDASGENGGWGNPDGSTGAATVYVAEPMAIDHRPARPCERQRLEAAGGRVQSKRTEYGGLIGEPRLWLKDIDMPGLLVSRSLGDEIAATVGCTAEPEILHTTLDFMKHRYLILASDGVWDVLNNQYVVDLCRGKDVQEACDSIVQASLMEWEDRYQADNISVVVVKFPVKRLDPAGS